MVFKEHIQDDIQFIETIISAIKNNGYWFLSTPNEEKMSLKKNNNKFHFRHYTNKMVNDIFKKYNLIAKMWVKYIQGICLNI